MLDKAALYRDYKRISEMEVPDPYLRARLLSELLGAAPDPWCVIGITPAALNLFHKNHYKRQSRMGINRAHICQRYKWLSQMLKEPFDDLEAWWDFYEENDQTVLSTASENMQDKFDETEIIRVPKHLFRSKGYAWTHGIAEQDFLREEYKKLQIAGKIF